MTESYCFACDTVVNGYPWTHENDAHPDEDVEVKRIRRTTNNGARITEADDGMSHYGPHQFVKVEGRLMCPKCGALKIESGGERE